MENQNTNQKTKIEDLLSGIDKQLLIKLLDSLISEQIPNIASENIKDTK